MKNSFSLSEVNSLVESDAKGFIDDCVNKYEQKINLAVENILKDKTVDIVLLAGPSSSGKTTTAGKLAQGIRTKGKNAYIISLDDFYLNRDDIPINSDGLPDYENVTAMDIPLIKKTFNSLINERSAVVPIFSFKTGKREKNGKTVHLNENDVVIVEGIHALNPIITDGVDPSHVYKIYISVSSRFTADNGRILLTKRNIRLVRRMIRDYHHRSSSVERTYFLWAGVRKGEDKFVFPYKNRADEFIDSTHPFEECMFRDEAIELLGHIDEESPYYDESQRLKESLEQFIPVSRDLLPENSLLHEFIE